MANNNNEMFTMDYEEAKVKYGAGQGSNKHFMSQEDFEKRKAEQSPKEPEKKPESLVANQFGNNPKKGKTWADLRKEFNDNPEEISNYLNNTPDYKPGELTKKGMAEFGYSLGEDGKWSNNSKTDKEEPTIDDALDGLEDITSKDKTIADAVDGLTTDTGDIDTDKANGAIDEYEQKLVEAGAAYYDKDGKFVFKPTNQKGWETWATLLSVGLSAVGLAMGIPIIPINFRAITGKDARDAQARALQQQYLNIKADDAANVSGMKSDVEAGNIALDNKEALEAQEKHSQATAATKDVIGAQSEADAKLIDKQSEARIKELKQELLNNEAILKLEQKHARDMAVLADRLSTASAKELVKYNKTWVVDYVKELKTSGYSDRDVALAIASLNGTTPTQMGLKNAESIVGMATETINTLKPGSR